MAIRRDYNSVPKPILQPTDKIITWAAGFIEGEGSFCRYENHGGFRVRISASQKNKEPLERLQKWFGGSIRPKKREKIWWEGQRRFIYSSSSWIWRIYGSEAIRVTKLLYRYLSQKRKNQAKELLDFSFNNPNINDKGPKKKCYKVSA